MTLLAFPDDECGLDALWKGVFKNGVVLFVLVDSSAVESPYYFLGGWDGESSTFYANVVAFNAKLGAVTHN